MCWLMFDALSAERSFRIRWTEKAYAMLGIDERAREKAEDHILAMSQTIDFDVKTRKCMHCITGVRI